MNFFASLIKFGFTNLSNINIFKVEDKKKSTNHNTEKKVVKETDLIFDKKYECTCCGKEILSKTVKTGKIRITKTDLDLRNKYSDIDPYKYEIIFCPHCGYASLASSFTALTEKQIRAIKTNVSAQFKCNQELLKKSVYDYQDAITLHELALLNVVVKEGKNSEKAYLCLKLSWLYRGAVELLDTQKDLELIEKYKISENEFLKEAYKGFMLAREKESFPIAGMNENTLDYMIAAIGYEIDEKDCCMRLLGGVITNRTATRNIKNKALNLKEIIVKDKHKTKIAK